MREVIKSIKRTPYQSFASFLILFFTLSLSLFFFVLVSFFYGILSYVEAKPQVTVYFQTDTGEADIFKIRDTVASSGKTSSVRYISKKEALEIYQELNKDNPLLLEMVSEEILPASLEIYTKRPEYLSEIAEFLKKQPGVDEVVFQKNIVDTLLSLTNALRRVSMFIFIFLIIITVVVLMTTTAFKIAAKKDELELKRLLGASKFSIRLPFLAEGVFFGFVAGTVAFGLFLAAFFYLQPFLKSYLTGIPNLSFYNLDRFALYVWPPSLNFIVLSYLFVVFFGAAIGLVGNFFASSKYIK